jgi:hypothetical protein
MVLKGSSLRRFMIICADDLEILEANTCATSGQNFKRKSKRNKALSIISPQIMSEAHSPYQSKNLLGTKR